MGDFNINLLDYSTSPAIENFLKLIISRNFYPVISHTTHVTPISCTLIDNIFSNRVMRDRINRCNDHKYV